MYREPEMMNDKFVVACFKILSWNDWFNWLRTGYSGWLL
jgi:hypothetical protein